MRRVLVRDEAVAEPLAPPLLERWGLRNSAPGPTHKRDERGKTGCYRTSPAIGASILPDTRTDPPHDAHRHHAPPPSSDHVEIARAAQ